MEYQILHEISPFNFITISQTKMIFNCSLECFKCLECCFDLEDISNEDNASLFETKTEVNSDMLVVAPAKMYIE